jgi:hypothetical protein
LAFNQNASLREKQETPKNLPKKHTAGEARNSLKLGSPSPSINGEYECISSLTLPAERQKKAV